MEKATFGAGCFWGVEVTFGRIDGVTATAVGYEGGHLDNPTYQDVCTGSSGHAEVIEIDFDPAKVNYAQLLEVFWQMHDPTTLNRQGPDCGSQYRSAIFFHSPEQEQLASAAKQTLTDAGRFPSPIVTEISPATVFYAAEEYHQKYLEKRGLSNCH